jgi:hypothetical protein
VRRIESGGEGRDGGLVRGGATRHAERLDRLEVWQGGRVENSLLFHPFPFHCAVVLRAMSTFRNRQSAHPGGMEFSFPVKEPRDR